MKPHPTRHRIRKTVKWGGAAITVLLVGAWVGSGWWYAGWRSENGSDAYVGGGRAVAYMLDGRWVKAMTGMQSLTRRGWWVEDAALEIAGGNPRFAWWFSHTQSPRSWSLAVPIWFLATPATLLTAVAWRLDTLARRRDRNPHLCPKCGYDRTGLAGGAGAVCPECGKGAA